MSKNSEDEVEEERRLHYVALTRAKVTSDHTYAKTRFRNGETVQTRPSRFLSEIGKKFVQIETSSDFSDNSQSATFVNPMDRYNSFRTGGKKSFSSTYDYPYKSSYGVANKRISDISGNSSIKPAASSN